MLPYDDKRCDKLKGNVAVYDLSKIESSQMKGEEKVSICHVKYLTEKQQVEKSKKEQA